MILNLSPFVSSSMRQRKQKPVPPTRPDNEESWESNFTIVGC